MSRIVKENAVNFVLVLTGVAVVAALYGRMPQTIPVHWGPGGAANGWMPKSYGAWVLPGVNLLLLAMFAALPKVSPKGWGIERFGRAYQGITGGVLGFLTVLTVVAAWVQAGGHANVTAWTVVAFGVLLMILGNYLGKVSRNFFVGIRTPWTLADDEVWLRTHRLAGKLFVLSGVATLLATVFGAGALTLVVSAVAAALISVVYSFVINRRIGAHAG